LHIKYTTNSDFDNLDKSKRLGTRIDTRLEKAVLAYLYLFGFVMIQPISGTATQLKVGPEGCP